MYYEDEINSDAYAHLLILISLFYSRRDLEFDLMNLEDPMKIPLLPFSDSGDPEFVLGLDPTFSLPLETLKQKENRFLAYALKLFNEEE